MDDTIKLLSILSVVVLVAYLLYRNRQSGKAHSWDKRYDNVIKSDRYRVRGRFEE
jgi:hypothetical protein